MFLSKKGFSFFLFISLITINSCFPLPDSAREKGFVYLHEVDPTILTLLRYLGNENFVGTPVDGYEKPVVIMTRQAAEALKRVQEEVTKDGYSLVVYDAYRPQRAVEHFIHWSKNPNDQLKKDHYYPHINKENIFKSGYLKKHSSHTRGSTIDVTLIKLNKKLHDVIPQKRTLLQNYTITYLEDGTEDFGSSFDLLGPASHPENDIHGVNNFIEDTYKKLRTYLKTVMEKHGFKNSDVEWWHFTLKNEPFPADRDDSYFDFPVA